MSAQTQCLFCWALAQRTGIGYDTLYRACDYLRHVYGVRYAPNTIYAGLVCRIATGNVPPTVAP